MLDEATAAVDVETDSMLQATLRSPLFSNRTIITVAHRLNTIMDSDRIIVLDKGEIVETGRHDQLMRKGGLYASLYMQSDQKKIDNADPENEDPSSTSQTV